MVVQTWTQLAAGRTRCVVLWAAISSGTFAFAEELRFEADIRPILKAHCLDCHGASDELQGKLDLRLVRLMQAGGESGPAIEPRNPAASLLLQRIKAGEMPPGQVKVSAREIALLERWIAAGAQTARPEPAEIGKGLGITEEERAYWAFRPITRPPVPELAGGASGPLHPIDAFLLAKLQERGVSFGPEADKLTLIKRATFDLLGLPPTHEEIDRFLQDDQPGAYERLLDRLLASPHYGERWARHWLDVVGYADSDGNSTADNDRPWAYKYRDWVIRAFNNDKPLDEFIIEQLAGDELLHGKFTNLSPQEIDLLTATGYLRMVKDGTNGAANADEAKNVVVADTLKMVGSSLLGLTVGCAECHDHRYDPISQLDYYRLRAVFEPALNWKRWAGRLQTLYTDADRAAAAAIEADVAKVADERNARQTEFMAKALEMELAKYPEHLRDTLREACNTPADKRSAEQQQLLSERPSLLISPGNLYQYLPKEVEELKALDARMAEMRSKKPVEEFLLCLMEDSAEPPTTHLFHRGDYRQPKEAVTPAMLEVATPPDRPVNFPIKEDSLPSTGRRLAFARHLVSGRDPLFPRVLANRIWMHHFGRGIVGSPGDFGRLGETPTHPELLDWLAVELFAPRSSDANSFTDGQRPGLKRFHRLLMTTVAYRQSSARRPELDAVDPDNQLLGRMSVRRLDAEALRDRLLAAAGTLQPTLFGPPIPVTEDAVGQVVVSDTSRRSIYIQQKRSKPESMLRAFDAPVMECNCEKRPSSTVAPQSLLLMNNDFVLKQAAALAERARREAANVSVSDLDPNLLPQRPQDSGQVESSLVQQIAAAWRIAYLRPITPPEYEAVSQFFHRQFTSLKASSSTTDPELQVLTNLCQVLLTSNEFLYVD